MLLAMSIADSVKGAFVRSAVTKLTDGDKGSTMLGFVGGSLLAAHIDWSLLAGGFRTQESAMECGKAVGVLCLALWGWRTGKGGKAKGAAA
jgi:hypothetical protein